MERDEMIIGIGVDICAIDRMAKVIERATSLFYQRLFSEREYHYYRTLENPQEQAKWLACVFASKEAILKAAGTGLDGRYGLNTIDILAGPSSHPQVALPSFLYQKWGEDLRCHLSLTYATDEVLAWAILER